MNRIKNFILCLKYPFLKMRNAYTGKFCGYESTWFDCIDFGWQKAFGEQLLKDLKKAIKKDKCQKTFRFSQIKEKYGELRLYATGYGDESAKVLMYYEILSQAYCIDCGAPARYCTTDWIEYYCKNCMISRLDEQNRFSRIKDIDIELKNLRLTKKDIPGFSSSNKELENYIKSINWEELWDLKEDEGE